MSDPRDQDLDDRRPLPDEDDRMQAAYDDEQAANAFRVQEYKAKQLREAKRLVLREVGTLGAQVISHPFSERTQKLKSPCCSQRS